MHPDGSMAWVPTVTSMRPTWNSDFRLQPGPALAVWGYCVMNQQLEGISLSPSLTPGIIATKCHYQQKSNLVNLQKYYADFSKLSYLLCLFYYKKKWGYVFWNNSCWILYIAEGMLCSTCTIFLSVNANDCILPSLGRAEDTILNNRIDGKGQFCDVEILIPVLSFIQSYVIESLIKVIQFLGA